MGARVSTRRQALQAKISEAGNGRAIAKPGLISANPARSYFPQDLEKHLLTFVLGQDATLSAFGTLQLVSRSAWLLCEEWLDTDQGRTVLSMAAARQSSSSASKLRRLIERHQNSSKPGFARQTRRSMDGLLWPHFEAPLATSAYVKEIGLDEARDRLIGAHGANFHGVELSKMLKHGIPAELKGKPLSLSLSSPTFDYADMAALLTICEGRPLDLTLKIEEDVLALRTRELAVQLCLAIETKWTSGTLRVIGAHVGQCVLWQVLDRPKWRFEVNGSQLSARHRTADKTLLVSLHHRRRRHDPLRISKLHIEAQALSADDPLRLESGSTVRIDNIEDKHWRTLKSTVRTISNAPGYQVTCVLDLRFQGQQLMCAEQKDFLLKLPRWTEQLKLTGLAFDHRLFKVFLRQLTRYPLAELSLIDCGLEGINSIRLAGALTHYSYEVAKLELGVNKASVEWLMAVLPALARNPHLHELSIQANGNVHCLGLYALVDAILASPGTGTLTLAWRCGARQIAIDVPRNCSRRQARQFKARLTGMLKPATNAQ